MNNLLMNYPLLSPKILKKKTCELIVMHVLFHTLTTVTSMYFFFPITI